MKTLLNSITSRGQSGQLFGLHYMDHWDAWYNKTFTLAFSDGAMAGVKTHELRLEAGKVKRSPGSGELVIG